MKFITKLFLRRQKVAPGRSIPTLYRPRLLAVLVAFLIVPACMIAARIPTQDELVSLSLANSASGPIMSIRNNGNSPITGFVISLDTLNNKNKLTKYYYDVYCDYGADHEVPKGASVEMALPYNVQASSATPLATPIFQAALFKDGTAWGDPIWIKDLVERRSVLLLRLKEAIGILQTASDQQLSKDDTLSRLQLRRDELARENAGFPFESRRLHDKVLRMMMKNLSGDLLVNGKIPEHSVAVAQLAKYLNTWLAFLQAAKPIAATSSRYLRRTYEAAMTGVRAKNGGIVILRGMRLRISSGTQPVLRLASWNVGQSSTCHINSSQPLASTEGCGNNTYTLSAWVNSNAPTSYGSQTAFGLCYGGTPDCNGNETPQVTQQGGIVFNGGIDDSTLPALADFFWTYDDWQASRTSCTQCDANPTGIVITAVNNPTDTPTNHLPCP